MTDLKNVPSVDQVLQCPIGKAAIETHGHIPTRNAIRKYLDGVRGQLATQPQDKRPTRKKAVEQIARAVTKTLQKEAQPTHPAVFNLTGTILHTNLGRAVYARPAVEAATAAMEGAVALEFDLETGKRGQRDSGVARQLADLVGAEDACLVNNNASAVLLALATHSSKRETIVSRGELVEIGGSFRIPSVMEAAGAKLREVGTTNRTHLRDFEDALSDRTGAIMKVHTSNYVINGFTKQVPAMALAGLARRHGVLFIDDLGSGVLMDLSRCGLPSERTVQRALRDGADLVTFSGDKLLGGPQAGFIVGRKDLVAACNAHPIKRAVRLDKVRLAALWATLRLHKDPDLAIAHLPTIRFIARDLEELEAMAAQIIPELTTVLGDAITVCKKPCETQIGSGALPTDTIPSIAIRISAEVHSPKRLALALRRLPIPVVARISRNAVYMDLRCLTDVPGFNAQLRLLPKALCDGP